MSPVHFLDARRARLSPDRPVHAMHQFTHHELWFSECGHSIRWKRAGELIWTREPVTCGSCLRVMQMRRDGAA